jgi:hypothetical protein
MTKQGFGGRLITSLKEAKESDVVVVGLIVEAVVYGSYAPASAL